MGGCTWDEWADQQWREWQVAVVIGTRAITDDEEIARRRMAAAVRQAEGELSEGSTLKRMVGVVFPPLQHKFEQWEAGYFDNTTAHRSEHQGSPGGPAAEEGTKPLPQLGYGQFAGLMEEDEDDDEDDDERDDGGDVVLQPAGDDPVEEDELWSTERDAGFDDTGVWEGMSSRRQRKSAKRKSGRANTNRGRRRAGGRGGGDAGAAAAAAAVRAATDGAAADARGAGRGRGGGGRRGAGAGRRDRRGKR
eukprot:COSAG04_NODE_1025_length_8694_cov_9.768005_3_plen_249_part_00